MPQTNETILLQLQAALEATRGTDLAATRKVYAQFTPSYTRALMDFMDTSATLEGRRRVAYGREKAAGTALDICTYEDLAWWFQMGIKGGVTGVADAGTPIAYTYTFTPTLATDDLKSATFEFGDSGNPYQISQMMVNSFTLRMDADNDSEPGWMIDVELIGRDYTSTTFTAALTDRATEVILARGTKLYIDNAGGTIGTTQKTGSLIKCSITVNNNIHFKAFAEDVTYVAANKVGRGARTLDAQFSFEFDSDTEFTKYRTAAGAQRLIRLEQSGSEIHTSSSVLKRFRFDMYGYWNSWSRSDREGNLTADFGFAGFYDVTAAKTFTAEIVNALITLV
jgi:hypothetical protein